MSIFSISARYSATMTAHVRRLSSDTEGNILLIMTMALIPLTFAIGFGVDYSRAEKLQTQLNSIADTAALGAVDPAMLCQSSDTAKAAALGMFNSQVANLSDLTSVTPSVTINPVQSNAGCGGSPRTVTVSYTAKVRNLFSSILGAQTLSIGGSSSADASQPPSINFYIALDVSPSMLLPTTSTGIANLKSGVTWNGAAKFGWSVVGCDFACHSVNSQTWNYGNFVRDANGKALYTTGFDSGTVYRISCSDATVYDINNNQIGTNGSVNVSASACGGNFSSSSGTSNPITLQYKPTGQTTYTSVSVNYPDSWWLAENYATINAGQPGITLRLDAESPAAQSLTSFAYNVELQYASAPTPPIYKLQYFTFAYGAPAAMSTSPWGTMTDVATSNTYTFPSLTANAPLMAGIGCWTSSSSCPGNGFTDMTALFNTMQSTMPSTAGLGTAANPQNVLIILTDGAEDDTTGDGMTALNSNNIAQCNAIKATGTRIAILYTSYDPNTINYTQNSTFTNFANNQVPSIQSQLQACATKNSDGTYLLQTVGTDGDISGALTRLFQNVVQSSRLVQ